MLSRTGLDKNTRMFHDDGKCTPRHPFQAGPPSHIVQAVQPCAAYTVRFPYFYAFSSWRPLSEAVPPDPDIRTAVTAEPARTRCAEKPTTL